MTVVCIVQARMTSTRLPGKVLLPLGGQPMLARLAERLRRAGTLDAIAIATTTNATDDPIVALGEWLGLPCFRGSEPDVLSRFAGAATWLGAKHVVRVTSDCPLLAPALVDSVVEAYEERGHDYVSNMHPPTYPYGMAVEVFSTAALMEAHHEARDPGEREHVTPFIYWRPQRFACSNVTHTVDLSHHRWTVDTPEDYELVRLVFEALYPAVPEFTLDDALCLLAENPHWSSINQAVQQHRVDPITPIGKGS